MQRAQTALLGLLTFSLGLACAGLSPVAAQEPAAAPAAAPGVTAPRAVIPRKLAPGILTVIPPVLADKETISGPAAVQDIVDMPGLAVTPNFLPLTQTLHEMAKEVTLRREVWGLEFAFKPLRMVRVDIPQPNGSMQNKLIWYMVYRVTNRGEHRGPTSEEDRFGQVLYGVGSVNRDIRFFPHLVLEGLVERTPAEIEAAAAAGRAELYQRKAYLDRLIPAAIPAIYARERPGAGIRLHNSVEISQVTIKPSVAGNENAVWGVATWENIDPRIDYLSVFIQGLTNAFEYETNTAGEVVFKHKTLQLNFWRPGDWLQEDESEIHYGVPIVDNAKKQAEIYSMYQVTEPLDFRWIFR
ncbi:hypothetical protein [Lignipirellula cremea]|uniref:Uncharacterized protein n=1 Tax=Lignipirellula cremea TaxID=2528010 RepID=A0A518DPP7_9BACT|nr:hypothetical protein [Lignipirellula cremea]QDU93811.1 hypothetical protein Pla8534_15940 [Lignipirellula cremea]